MRSSRSRTAWMRRSPATHSSREGPKPLDWLMDVGVAVGAVVPPGVATGAEGTVLGTGDDSVEPGPESGGRAAGEEIPGTDGTCRCTKGTSAATVYKLSHDTQRRWASSAERSGTRKGSRKTDTKSVMANNVINPIEIEDLDWRIWNSNEDKMTNHSRPVVRLVEGYAIESNAVMACFWSITVMIEWNTTQKPTTSEHCISFQNLMEEGGPFEGTNNVDKICMKPNKL